MTTFRRFTGVALGAVLLSVSIRGQDTAGGAVFQQYMDERGGLGLDDAIARAIDREPTLRATRAEIEVARGQRQQAGLRPNPTLTFERRDEPGGSDSLTAIGVEWPLDLFRRQARVRTAEQELEATRLGVADRERLIVGEVRMQYGAAAAAVRELQVLDELVATARRQLSLVSARASEGSIAPLERDLLDVEARRLEAQRILAQGRADMAVVHLKQVLGMRPDEPLALRESLESLMTGALGPAPPNVPDSITERSDVRAAGARVAVAQAQVDQARREGRIDVSLMGTYMRMDAAFPQRGFDAAGVLQPVHGRFNYVAGGARMTLPLLNRNQGGLASALAAQSGAEARREAAELAARSEVASAQARDTRAQQAVAVYADGARALAQRNLDVVRQTFDLGRATVFDVLAEQRRYLELEQAYTAALREAWDARVSLKRARGDIK